MPIFVVLLFFLQDTSKQNIKYKNLFPFFAHICKKCHFYCDNLCSTDIFIFTLKKRQILIINKKFKSLLGLSIICQPITNTYCWCCKRFMYNSSNSNNNYNSNTIQKHNFDKTFDQVRVRGAATRAITSAKTSGSTSSIRVLHNFDDSFDQVLVILCNNSNNI